MIYYHFTSAQHLSRIMAEGFLKPSESNISPTRENAGPPVVWLTDVGNARNERGLDGSTVDKTKVRFTVDIPAVRWQDWIHTADMNPTWKEALIKSGGGQRVANHWYVFPGKIPFSRWVEIHVNGQLWMQRDEASQVLPRGERLAKR